MFFINIHNIRLRELRTRGVGKLTSICGTVTRTSEVRPELLFGTFTCLDCHTIIKDVEQQFKYTLVLFVQTIELNIIIASSMFEC